MNEVTRLTPFSCATVMHQICNLVVCQVADLIKQFETVYILDTKFHYEDLIKI